MTGPETTAVGAFTEEFQESLPAILSSLAAAEEHTDAAAAREAHRLIHALKGAASMVGLAALGHLLHLAEERLEPSASGREPLRPDTCAAVRDSIPLFAAYVDAALAHRATAPLAIGLARTMGSDDGPAAVAALEGLIEIERREIASQVETDSEPAADATSATPEPVPLSDIIDAAADALPVLAPVVQVPAATDVEVDVLRPDEIPAELAEVFALESQEHLETIARLTSQLSGSPDRDSIQELRRAVHTLKGAAGVVGFKGAATLAHRMEDFLDRLYEGTAVLTPQAIRTLASSSDALHDLIVGTPDADALRARVGRLFAELGALLGETPVDEAPANRAVVLDEPMAAPRSTPEKLAPAIERRRGPRDRRGGQALRVPLARLNELIRVVSELVINRSTFEQHHAGLIDQVDELKLSTARLRKVAHRLESDYEVRALGGQAGRSPAAAAGHGFDELEFDRYTEFHLLTRELVETTSDIATIGARIAGAIRDFDGDLTHFGRLTREIQDKTMDFRMVPLETMRTQLERVVRATAESCGKPVELMIEGAAVSLDKSLLEQMSDPILHLLRNGIDHGIEPPERRAAANKPAHGSITVRARHEGTDVLIEVEDDGAGLDAERIRQTAIAKGYIDANTATTPEGLHALIFEPGFSTASAVTEVSGRGVGMDVVKAKVARFGGRVTLTSRRGAGTTVSVRVPMTVSMTRILVVRSGGEMLGLPLNAVMQIVRPHPSAIGVIGTQRVLTVDCRTYPMRDLADMLGLARTTDARTSQPVLIATLSGRRIALAVDEILNSRDAVVKPLGTHLRRVPRIWGATVLGDGTVVLILNPADLAGETDDVVVAPVSRAPAAAEDGPYTILIVDDSLSMRHVLSTAVKKAGWIPVPARDGLEALEIVQGSPRRPDLVLLDIEMPRMDGFEFLSTIRSQKANADLPVVMLTSRGSDKHRDKARALGATDYMVKPFQEDTLTRNIDRLVQASRRSEKRAAS